MVQIPVYESRGSVTGGGAITPEPSSDIYNLTQVAGERIAKELEATRRVEDQMFVANKSAELVRLSETIREDMEREQVPFEAWGPEYRNRYNDQVSKLGRELTNPTLRNLMMNTVNEVGLRYEANLFEQSMKLKKDAQLTEFQNNFDTLQTARSKAGGAERAALDGQIEGMLGSAQMSGLLAASDVDKLRENVQENDVKRFAVDGNFAAAKAALDQSSLPEEKKIALKNTIEAEQRQRVSEARQASFFEREGYRGLLLRDPTSPQLTDEALLENAMLTARDRESIRLERDRVLQGIGGLQSQQEDMLSRLDSGQFNPTDRDQVNALNFFYSQRGSTLSESQKVDLATSAGRVPDQMAMEMVTQIYNGNPEQRAAAYSMYSQIESVRPDAVKAIESYDKNIGYRAQQYNNLVLGGLSPAEASNKVQQAFSAPPKDEAARKDIEKQAVNFARTTVDDVLNDIKSRHKFEWGEKVEYGPAAEGQVSAFLSEYVRSSLMAGSDLKAAKDYAQKKASQNFGLSQVGGNNTIMFAPPEKYAKIPSAEIEKNVTKSVPSVKMSEFSFVSDAVTQQQVMSGGQPTYAISYVDEFGAFAQLPARFNPDGSLASDGQSTTFSQFKNNPFNQLIEGIVKNGTLAD